MFQNIFYKPIFGQIHKKKHIILLLQFLTTFSRKALPLPLSAKNPCREPHPPAPPPSPERNPYGGGGGRRIKEKAGKGPGRKEGRRGVERGGRGKRNEKDRTGRKRRGEACRRPGKAIKKILPRKPVPFPGKELAGEDS